jgi:C-terminal processing protease CtpA/Prc
MTMAQRAIALCLAASIFSAQALTPAFADNQMGYQLVTAEEAARLPHNDSLLGIQAGAGQQINSKDLNFELLKVQAVRPGSPGAKAGFKSGDQLIAVDGRVFANTQAFANFVGSIAPGRHVTIDYMPAGTGPKAAKRVDVQLAAKDGSTISAEPGSEREKAGMSRGKKVAIGAAAIALFGCYKMGCFSRSQAR